jgi:creatinine amidohydrolase/Fe(II)-dependent formamide hydrolase-like protein
MTAARPHPLFAALEPSGLMIGSALPADLPPPSTPTAAPDAPLGDDGLPLFHEWALMTAPQIAGLPRDRTVIMVTASPLEVHGPHLPTITDICEAEGLGVRMMRRLRALHPEMVFVRLPPIYVASDVLPHVGSLHFRPSTIRAVYEDLGRSLCKQGFRHVWVGGFHGGPRHFVPVEQACDAVNRRHGARMLSIFGMLLNQLTGGDTDLADILGSCEGIEAQQLRGDAHGGAIETSMMLALLGRHVDPMHKRLGHNDVHLARARTGKASVELKGRPSPPELVRLLLAKLRYYEEETWSGDPSLATPELGEQFLDVLAGHAAGALSKVWTGQIPITETKSPAWKMRHLFSSAIVGALLPRVLGSKSPVF